VRQLRHRDARNPRLKQISIEYMNLHATTTYTRVLLKCRLEYAASEIDTREAKTV
jgi:hypothetical protein